MKKVFRLFTGVYGVLEKKDKTGKLNELYLHPSIGNGGQGVEVPLIIWKLVIDVKTNHSVAFFTSNDTDMNKKQAAYFSTLCRSVCNKFGYGFNAAIKSGVTLCCEYRDFVRHIRYLPVNLKNSTLLINESSFGKPKKKKPTPPPAAWMQLKRI